MTEFGVAKLNPPVWWNVSQVVSFAQVPTIDPPFQHKLPLPVGETGQSSTCVHDAPRASTARRPLIDGLNRLLCAPPTDCGLWLRHALAWGTGTGAGGGVGVGTGVGVGVGVGTGTGMGVGTGVGVGVGTGVGRGVGAGGGVTAGNVVVVGVGRRWW